MAIGTRRHRLLVGENVGTVVRWTVANSTARLALLLDADDVGSIARQTDDNSYHILANYSTPTWVQLGATVNVTSSANAPTVNDDELSGYQVGSLWIRTAVGSESFYCLADATAGAAVWVLAAGGGAAATWGTITGTLSAQTDLQTALDAKKPNELSGAGDPGVSTGNGLALGTIYVNTTDDTSFTLVDATTDANVWFAGGGGAVDSVFGRTGAVVAVAGDYSALQIDFENVIGSPTYGTVEGFQNATGAVSSVNGGGVISDAGAGTINVSAGQGYIRSTDSDTADLFAFDFGAASGLALTDNDMNYVYVEYNAGSPQVVATVTKRTDENTNIFLGNVYRSGTTLHITNHKNPAGNVSTRLTRRLTDVDGLVRATGLVISETGTRNVACTAGVAWHGLDEENISAVDTAVADTFTYYYRDGVGGWTTQTTQTQINNTQYDDGSGTLASLGTGRYGLAWVYRGIDNDLYVLFGQGNYTSAQWADAAPPASVPPHFEEQHTLLVGRIAILVSASTFTDVASAWETQFTASGATDHGELAGLTDDDHTQYHTDARGDARYLRGVGTWTYTASTPTSAGEMQTNTATVASITTIKLYQDSTEGGRFRNALAEVKEGDHILLTDVDDLSQNATFRITDIPTIEDAATTVLFDVSPDNFFITTLSGTYIVDVIPGSKRGGVLFAEHADHTYTPAAGYGEIWLDNAVTDTYANLRFTDGNTGTDSSLVRTLETNVGNRQLATWGTNGNLQNNAIEALGTTLQGLGGLEFEERATIEQAVGTGQGTFWVKSDTPCSPMFTEDTPNDLYLLTTSALPGNNEIILGTSGTGATDSDSAFNYAGGSLNMTNGTGARIRMTEAATDGITVNAGQGAYWVKNTTPSSAFFTDDSNVEHKLNLPRDISLATSETVALDKTETVIGGAYIDGGTGGTYTWEIMGEYIDGGGAGNQDLEIRLYERGPDGTPTAGTLRSVLEITAVDTLDRVSLTLTASASPGVDTDTIQDAARFYEVRAYIDATGNVDSAYIHSVRFIES